MGILFNCSKNRIKNPPINSQSRQNTNNRENNILQIQLNPKDNNINTLRTQSNLIIIILFQKEQDMNKN